VSGVGFLRLGKIKGRTGVLNAARHNKRAIQAEHGAQSHIDPRRSELNESLHGPNNPGEVAQVAKDRMAAAGIANTRKDAVMAVEIIFSLPVEHIVDERAFFVCCWEWAAEEFGGVENILSVDIHRDEAAPHCHVLILPLQDGRMVGSRLMGNRKRLSALQNQFHLKVGRHFGLRKAPKRVSTATKASAAKAVERRLRERHDGAIRSALWPNIRDLIYADPAPYLLALGMELPNLATTRPMKTMAQIFISKGKGKTRESKPIGFDGHSAQNEAAGLNENL
jgi:Plasmid recombination enzyme